MMLRALCFSTALLIVPCGNASADGPSELGANAALKYWQAFATLPKFTDAEQKTLIGEPLTMPLDAQTRESVNKAEYALRMLHQGAVLPRCDWAVDWEASGIEALLPQLIAARVTTSLACLRARIRFEEGQRALAIDDVVAAITLGRHVSLDGSLISVLVGYAIEGRLSDAIALYLPQLDPAAIRDLKARLDGLPQGGSPAVGLRVGEEKTLDWFINKVKAANDKERLLALATSIALLAAKPEEIEQARKTGGQALLDKCGGTAASLLQVAEAARPSYRLMAEKMALPIAEFDKEFERESARQAGNPVFQIFFPAMSKARQSQARADVRYALLAAAFAIQLDGPDALVKHPDPVAGGPFEYAKYAGGFELRSKFDAGGKPPVLTVGRRGN
jgi:hypothetical protein